MNGAPVTVTWDSCERLLDSMLVRGERCVPSGSVLYHHTAFKNLQPIVNTGALMPSTSRSDDAVVNLTANPDLHRFGEVRFVFDREKVEVQPVCYTEGEDDKVRTRAADQLADRLDVSPWRAESLMGMEPWTFKHECKQASATPVPVNSSTLRALEYWLPWVPGKGIGASVGCNVHPPTAHWDTWSTGVRDVLGLVREQIAETKETARRLGVPFRVRTCYPWASAEGANVIVFDEVNLRRLEDGEEPILTPRHAELPESRCLCGDETEILP